MRRYYLSAAIGSCLGLLVLAGCAAPPSGTASQAPVPALQPGMARVWVLRQPSSPGGNIAASDPMVFANGQPLAQSAQGTAFFHDFLPGTCSFTVQPYGTPTNFVDILQLAPGMEVYVQVEGVPNWELSAAGGASFVVMPMSPEEGKGYFQIMKNLGQR
jgi:hypothetical protein